MLTIGDKLPSFSLLGVIGNDLKNAFANFDNDSQKGKWKVFIFYPKDFTFICPTELEEFNNLIDEFKEINTALYGVSTDSEFVHLAWRCNNKKLGSLRFPLLSDIKHEFSNELGIIHKDEGVCLRATIIVDYKDIIRHISVNDLDVGRNSAETLRITKALQCDGLMPCNWQPGEKPLEIA